MILHMRLQTLFLGIVLLFGGCSKSPAERTIGPSPSEIGGASAVASGEEEEGDASEGCGPLPDAVIQKKRAQEDEAEALKSAKAGYAELNELDAYLSRQMGLARLAEGECAKSARVQTQPYRLCKAALLPEKNSCDALGESERIDCRDYKALRAAWEGNAPAGCLGLSKKGPQELCKYVAGGAFSCPDSLGESFLSGCQWVKEHGEKACEGSPRACNTAHFVQAMKLNDSSRCGLIEDPGFQAHCRGMVTGNVEMCQSTASRLPSCRRALLAPPRLIKVSQGWEGHLYFKNGYDEKASCMGAVRMERGGKVVTSLPVSIPGLLSGDGVKTIRIPLTGLVGGESFTYDGSCQWFYDKGAKPGVEKDNGVFDE